MSLTFYHSPYSTSSATKAVLLVLGVEHTTVNVDLSKGETRTLEFLRINPNGRIPVLVVGDEVLFESAAIAVYLGEEFGVKAGLFPPAGIKRAHAIKWLIWSCTTLAAAASAHTAQLPSKEGPAFEKSRKDLEGALIILDAQLASTEYVNGSFSIVDAHIRVLIGWIQAIGVSLAEFRNLSKWLELCVERPQLVNIQ